MTDATMDSPSSRLWLSWSLLGLFATALLWHALSYWAVVDDAFISFRYTENLVNGHGLVFNAGERVEGYTNFLWVLLMVIPCLVGADLATSSQVLGAFFSLATLVVVYRAGLHLGLGHWRRLLPCAIVSASAPVAMWAGGGLETPLFMFLVTLALTRAVQELTQRSDRPWSGIVFGLATLTRPEGLGLFVVCVGVALLRGEHRRTLVRMLVGFCAVFVPHFLFRLGYYGHPWPNTFYAKTSMSQEVLQNGWTYLQAFLGSHGYWALPALAGLALRESAQQPRRLLIPLAVLLAAAGYIVVVGGDFMPFARFCAPYVPLLALLLCIGASRLGDFFARYANHDLPRRLVSLALPIAVAAAVALPAKQWRATERAKAFPGIQLNGQIYAEYARWLRQHRSPETLVAGSAMGRIPYFTGFRTIDMLGLTDAHVAHGKLTPGRGAIAHQRHDSAYILARKPDLVLVEFCFRDFDFDARTEVATDKIFSRMVVSWGAWPALTDLVSRHEFRLAYAPRVAEVKPSGYCFFFERDETLSILQDRAKASQDPRLLFQLALQYRQQGLLNDAIQSLRQVVAADSANVNPRLNVAYYYFEASRIDEALAEYRQLEVDFPEEPRVHYALGMALYSSGRRAESVRPLREFVEMAPTSALVPKAMEMLQDASSSRRPGHPL